MTAKVTNDAVAFIRSLAEMRARNAEWAEQAVREAASLSSQAALERTSSTSSPGPPRNFSPSIDGREVEIAGERRRLAHQAISRSVETVEQGWLIRLLL